MKTADKWEDNASYQLAKERCSKIQVINDSTERGKVDPRFLACCQKRRSLPKCSPGSGKGQEK